MSTFGGKIVEIPEISVDNFGGSNKTSLVYFLSHCHSDHMRGLGDFDFQNALISRDDVYLYASPISVKILKNIYRNERLGNKFKEISIFNSTLIKIPHIGRFFTVTAVPAGHCPGSVMFLFETNDKSILYTGDYRVSARDLEKYKAFYSSGNIKTIHKMYLDTTFFTKSYLRLPPRQDSIDSICSYIREWLDLSPKNLVNITPSANYGAEYLLMEVSREMLMPVHVNQKCYNVYKCIPEMDSAVTLDPSATRIHSNCGKKFKQICLENAELVRKITASTLWWKGKDIDKGHVDVSEDRTDIKVCYSSHASFEEIKEFLLFLKPLEIEPCVVPENLREKRDMMKLLEDVTLTYKVNEAKDENVKLFTCPEDDEFQDGTVGQDSVENLLHSPTSSFKRRRKWLMKQDENDC